MTSVGIVGASGYTGAELLRLCSQHPQLDVRVATADSQAGARVAEVYPSLAAAFPALTLAKFDAESCDGLDLVFLAMPHGASQDVVPDLAGRVGRIVDLAADFRLEDPGSYRTWYGAEHARPDLLGSFAYGLPELFRADIAGASRVAAPGCYVTAAVLALAPLLRCGLVESSGIVVDAASGVSGAGRSPKPATAFCAVGRGLHRLRPADPPAHARDRAGPEPGRPGGPGAGPVHAAPCAHEPGNPRHVLRPPLPGPAPPPPTPWTRCGPPGAASRSWW